MGIWYVKQIKNAEEICKENKHKLIQKLVYLWKKTFGIVTLKEVGNKTIALLPEGDLSKIAQKLCKKIYDRENQNLVLSSELMEQKNFVNYLYSNNFNILNGRWLFSYLIEEVLDYIGEKSGKPVETMEVSVMVNDNSEKNLKTIVDIALKVKMLNIITNHIETFMKLEEYLYNRHGILVRVTNNTKKSLLKTNVIVNLDFPEELVNKYSLPKKGIIVNIGEEVHIRSKRFSGINVNFFEIDLPEEKFFRENNLLGAFDSAILYESVLHRKGSYESIREQIKENKSNIKNLVGINGIICEKEYKDSQ